MLCAESYLLCTFFRPSESEGEGETIEKLYYIGNMTFGAAGKHAKSGFERNTCDDDDAYRVFEKIIYQSNLLFLHGILQFKMLHFYFIVLQYRQWGVTMDVESENGSRVV